MAQKMTSSRPGRLPSRAPGGSLPLLRPSSSSIASALRGRRLAAALAAVVLVGAVVSGTVDSTDISLVVMGFDPDRAQLITSLIIGGAVAATAAFVVPSVRYATLVGAVAVGTLYVQTFATETSNALSATGALGYFSPGGWVLTLVTLVTIATISAAAGAALAIALRPSLIAVGSDLRRLVASGLRAGGYRRPFAALMVLVLLFVTLPAFGDMVNLSPDALMLGGVDRVPLAGDTPGLVDLSTPTPEASPTDSSTDLPAGSPIDTAAPTPTESPTPSGPKPWLAWKPSGLGNVTTIHMPAPWVHGSRTVADVSIYTPPGYSATGSRTYPVIYEAPTGLTLWNGGTGAIHALDSLIDGGSVPAALMVFIDEWGAPYPDSECADSSDGKMWMETFISKTVVEYVDSHYKTIRSPSARAIMGMSTGGFCAAMLTLRHPGAFGTSISFSGYFEAGAASANSARPFGSQAALTAHSPSSLLGTIPLAQRSSLYFVVIADPNQPLYGNDATAFDQRLTSNSYPHDAVLSNYPHGWPEVRYEFPTAVEDWAERLVVDKVF